MMASWLTRGVGWAGLLLGCWLAAGVLEAQPLGELQFEEVPSNIIVPGDAAVLVVESAISPLSFGSRGGGIRTVRAVLEGYEEARDSVMIEAGRTTRVRLRLTARTGALYVVSSPVEGAMYLDGRSQGRRTPGRLEGLLPGSYRVTVQREGFEDGEATATVAPERTTTVTVSLREGFQ